MLTMNAMLMGVFERIPVFGVMKAVGFSGGKLFVLIVCETLVQVTLAAILAVALGWPLSTYFERNPIDFSFLLKSSSTIAGVAFEPQWYCMVSSSSVLQPVIFLYVVSLLAICYPALKAAMISPVNAIHHQ
jgi:putative ABC transport system permease protein